MERGFQIVQAQGQGIALWLRLGLLRPGAGSQHQCHTEDDSTRHCELSGKHDGSFAQPLGGGLVRFVKDSKACLNFCGVAVVNAVTAHFHYGPMENWNHVAAL
jgi:hypothetical protein